MTYADAINLKIGQTVYWVKITEDSYSIHWARVEGIVTKYGSEAYVHVSSLPDKPIFHEHVHLDRRFAAERAYNTLSERIEKIRASLERLSDNELLYK